MDLPPRDRPSAQGMDVTTVRAVVSDLRRRLLPSRFEKAQQPDPHSLQLGFRTLTGMVWLELSWQADLPRLVLIPPPRRQGGAARWRNRSSTVCDNWLSCRSSSRASSGW